MCGRAFDSVKCTFINNSFHRIQTQMVVRVTSNISMHVFTFEHTYTTCSPSFVEFKIVQFYSSNGNLSRRIINNTYMHTSLVAIATYIYIYKWLMKKKQIIHPQQPAYNHIIVTQFLFGNNCAQTHHSTVQIHIRIIQLFKLQT